MCKWSFYYSLFVEFISCLGYYTYITRQRIIFFKVEIFKNDIYIYWCVDAKCINFLATLCCECWKMVEEPFLRVENPIKDMEFTN